VSEQTLRNWRRQDQIDRHERDDGLTSDEREELRRLRRGNARLKQQRDLLKRRRALLRPMRASA
jgi:transposase